MPRLCCYWCTYSLAHVLLQEGAVEVAWKKYHLHDDPTLHFASTHQTSAFSFRLMTTYTFLLLPRIPGIHFLSHCRRQCSSFLHGLPWAINSIWSLLAPNWTIVRRHDDDRALHITLPFQARSISLGRRFQAQLSDQLRNTYAIERARFRFPVGVPRVEKYSNDYVHS